MALSGPLSWGRELLRPIDMLTSLWSTTAAIPPVAASAGVAYQTLFNTLRRLVVGRTLSVRLGQGDITLTVTELDAQLDPAALAVGQLDNVRLVATDLRWEDSRLDRATVKLHNVHLRPGGTPILVAAPVDMTVQLPTSILEDLMRKGMPRLSGEIGDDAVARLRWARRPLLGSLEIGARLDGSTLWLKPSALALRRRRWRIPARIPAYPVRLPDLPHGLRLTGISFGPAALQVTGILPEWRMDLPKTGLEDVFGQLNSMGRTLNLTMMGRLW